MTLDSLDLKLHKPTFAQEYAKNISCHPDMIKFIYQIICRSDIPRAKSPIILDIGGGAGIVKKIITAARKNDDFTYLNVDVDSDLLRQSQGYPIHADRMQLPFANNSIDFTLYFFPQRGWESSVMKEIGKDMDKMPLFDFYNKKPLKDMIDFLKEYSELKTAFMPLTEQLRVMKKEGSLIHIATAGDKSGSMHKHFRTSVYEIPPELRKIMDEKGSFEMDEYSKFFVMQMDKKDMTEFMGGMNVMQEVYTRKLKQMEEALRQVATTPGNYSKYFEGKSDMFKDN